MKLYHGSNQIIKVPDLSKSRKYLDFGKGFYLSVAKKQAESRALSSRRFFNKGIPTVNIYEYNDLNNNLNIMIFNTADINWLDFVIANRRGESVNQHDIIIGPTANDKTILTIDQYMQGIFAHLDNPKEMVIKMLLPEKLDTQYLFTTKKALGFLDFIETYEI